MPKKIKKILIIEDDVPIASALNNKLAFSGYKTSVASDGQMGLEMALTVKPDLILLDIIMPKMDGITMLEKLQKNKEGKEIPVIILTNLSDAEMVRKAQDNGVHDFLIKSDWRLEDVVKKIQEKIG